MSMELLRELGRGGMATVYLARDQRLGREVAIKVLHENLLTDEEAVARFEREARVVAKLEHPNILGLYGLTEVMGERLGLVMPYVHGGTLAARLKRAPGGLPLEEVGHITRGVLRGLAYSHERGVVHRDIKPGNVFLREGDRRVLIADFGIARAAGVHTALTQTGASMGTPNYMAPEQIDSVSDVDGQADVYAVGMMMWEMLTGERPWGDETLFNVIFKQKTEDLESPKKRRPEIPEALVEVWRAATRKDRDERWPSAEVMLQALDAVDRRTTAANALNSVSSALDEGQPDSDATSSFAFLPASTALPDSVSPARTRKLSGVASGAVGRPSAPIAPSGKGESHSTRAWRGHYYVAVAATILMILMVGGGALLYALRASEPLSQASPDASALTPDVVAGTEPPSPSGYSTEPVPRPSEVETEAGPEPIPSPPEVERDFDPEQTQLPGTPEVPDLHLDEDITIPGTMFEDRLVDDLPPPPEQAEMGISDQPTFTPFTVSPVVLNMTDVMRATEREYPTMLRDTGIGGTVMVHLFIDTEGVVQNALVARSSGQERLDLAALRVAYEFEFEPARNDDTVVPVWVQLPISFQAR